MLPKIHMNILHQDTTAGRRVAYFLAVMVLVNRSRGFLMLFWYKLVPTSTSLTLLNRKKLAGARSSK
jgi:hypothetical protein